MARAGKPKGGSSWYFREWMDRLRVRQVDIIEKTGWSKATTSQLYTGVQDYSPKLLREAAAALRLEPFELLMRPDEALALRDIKASAERIAQHGRVQDDAEVGDAARVSRRA